MSIALPATDSPIRDLFDMQYLASVLAPRNRPFLPTLREALAQARQLDWTGIAARHYVCTRADGSIILERVGPKGGHKTIWTFYRPA